jgi:hypothetical protein
MIRGLRAWGGISPNGSSTCRLAYVVDAPVHQGKSLLASHGSLNNTHMPRRESPVLCSATSNSVD